MGGAVATGTHGSSMRWGSLSSQVRGFQMLLANGSLLELNDPAENLHLWRAASVSVGRLGILTRLTMRIVPQQAVRRSLAEMDFAKFAQQVRAVGQEYAAAKATGDVDGQKRALSQLDETQAFW
jgi:FAD/FMN-containing dehydrogenase